MDFQSGGNRPAGDFAVYPQIHQIPHLSMFDFNPPLSITPSPSQAQWQGLSYYDAPRQQMWYRPTSQQRRAAFVEGQIHRHFPRPAEARPRLTKDETEILEMAFAVNQKPSTVVKRDIANRLAVNLAKVNNWFQNRRAKEKTIIKSREAEKRRAMERAASEAAKSPGDPDSGVVSQYYMSSDRHQPIGPSSAAIGEDEKEGMSRKERSATEPERPKGVGRYGSAGRDSEVANDLDSDRSAGSRSEESSPVNTPVVSETHSSPQATTADGLQQQRVGLAWSGRLPTHDTEGSASVAPCGSPAFQHSPANAFRGPTGNNSFPMANTHFYVDDFALPQHQGLAASEQSLYTDFSTWDFFSGQSTPPFSSGTISEAPSDEQLMTFMSPQDFEDSQGAANGHTPPTPMSASSLMGMNGLGICQ